MLSINKKIIFLLLSQLLYLNNSIAQIQFGTSYGYSLDFGKEILNNYKSNTIIDLNLKYINETLFHPSISVLFTKTPLNYSDQIIKNQGNYKTIVINNSTSIKLGIETVLKNIYKSNFITKFGFGASFFNNPLVWVENSNASYGFNTNYNSNKTEKSFAFVDLSMLFDREISDNWTIYIDIGSQYYPKNNLVSINTEINLQTIEINSSFTKLRPYAKLGVFYTIKK